jgi:5-hydroxyisourate hydrolase-like protein (transthyretin family)|tara:strand:- start:791 stop:1144 length:354 start_codon:yes stop_codon:yes gene_type:complete
MAVISSHTLDGSDGTHAVGISVSLKKTNSSDYLFQTFMDNSGRLIENVSPKLIDETATYELIFGTGAYWISKSNFKGDMKIMDEIVIRFKILNKDRKYHFPIILSPNSYSTWWSEGE